MHGVTTNCRPAPTLHVRPAADSVDWTDAARLIWNYAAWVEEHADVWLPDAQPGFSAETADLRAAYDDGAGVGEARRLGRRAIWLETADGIMARAIAIYERSGLRRVATPLGAVIDHPALITMQLDLRWGRAEQSRLDGGLTWA